MMPVAIKPIKKSGVTVLLPVTNLKPSPGQSLTTKKSTGFNGEQQPLPPLHLDAKELDNPQRLASVLMGLHEQVRKSSLTNRQDPAAKPSYSRGIATTATPSAPQVITVPHNLGRNYTGSHVVRHQGAPWSGAEVTQGAVTHATITAAGSGYTTPPTVTFSGGGGSGAQGVAVLVNGTVQSITITSPGKGYTSTPTITLAAGGGTNAKAQANVPWAQGTAQPWDPTKSVQFVTTSSGTFDFRHFGD